MANNKDLGLIYLRINPQHRSNCKRASLARSVLALCNQVDVLVLVWLDNHRDGDTLNVGWLVEVQLFLDALKNFWRDLEVVFVYPGSLLVDEWRSSLFRFELE